MKTVIFKRTIYVTAMIALFSLSSCKDNDVREGEMVGPDGIEAEPRGTTATDMAADTTNMAEEDSLIEAPSP